MRKPQHEVGFFHHHCVRESQSLLLLCILFGGVLNAYYWQRSGFHIGCWGLNLGQPMHGKPDTWYFLSSPRKNQIEFKVEVCAREYPPH